VSKEILDQESSNSLQKGRAEGLLLRNWDYFF